MPTQKTAFQSFRSKIPKIKRKANEFTTLWESKGVPTEFWNVINNCKDLVKKYGLYEAISYRNVTQSAAELVSQSVQVI